MSEGMYFTLITLIYGVCFIIHHVKVQRGFKEERQQWQNERADLLNRIQAGNYAEYKAQEIRLVKAQQGEEKKPSKLEQL